MKSFTRLFVSTLILTGCANPINLRTAQNYASSCVSYQQQGEWWKARQACGRATVNAELGGAEARVIAGLRYEYGRSSGVICDFPEAKEAIEKALASDKVNNGPIIMDYFELARLHFDQKLFKEATAYYQSGVAATSQEIIAQDPIGYADLLDEYAKALEQTGDLINSEKNIADAKKLRLANPNTKSLTKRTPYGKFCNQKS